MSNVLDPDDLVLTTASESQERSSRVLPNGPSEDARAILGAPPVPPLAASSSERDYVPDPQVEWAVQVDFGAAAARDEILGVLSAAWCEANGGPMVYGSARARVAGPT